ncbi:MAG: acyltransferase family protein [Fibrobacter sp.]|nr:acyltransferase family protein [Fibrobacter sp.]
MNALPSERIGWIDEFKGTVLLLVCLFHMEQSFANVQMGMAHASAFRMTAFFFISGVLFSTRRFPTIKSYAKHKAKVLLLPYILLSLLFLALDPVLYHFDLYYPRSPKMMLLGIVPEIQNVWQYIGWNLFKIFIVGKSSVGSGPIWFVFNLFCVSLAFYLVERITRGHFWKTFLISVASLLMGWTFNRYHVHLPFGIERVFTTLFFFANGYLAKDWILRLSKQKTIVLLFIAAISIWHYLFFETANPWFSIMNNDLGKNLGSFLASSIFGILALVSVFLLLDRLPDFKIIQIIKGILRNVSRNGLIILAVHWWILLLLRIVFKTQIDQPGTAYLSIPIVTFSVILAIPLFRNKLYRLISKEKIGVRESLSIR